VNVHESERERNGIICRQFCGVEEAAPIFRGAHQINWTMWAVIMGFVVGIGAIAASIFVN
jgi:hypothetical protein